ncbi:MAG: MBL fold metallo-hydrolase, partial [Planctomycetota bacterium]
ALLLGTAQDGGFPHAGCRCERCADARADPSRARRVACLGLVDAAGRGFLIDATPDLPSQIEALPALSGLYLTHAHMGHVAGLLWLGKEAMAVEGLPVGAGPRMLDHLMRNEPWASLFRDGHLLPDAPETDLVVEPLEVSHRAEWSETFGFRIRGPERTLLWLPDIDRFVEGALASLLSGVDLAFLDGTFYSPDELPGRDLSKIPHPHVRDTVEELVRLRPTARIAFVHLNHSNPVLDPESGPARHVADRLAGAGIAPAGTSYVAEEGLEVAL